MKIAAFFGLLALASGGPLSGGVYSKAELADFDPFIVMHPYGYSGTGGTITLGACTTPEAVGLVSALERAIATLNALESTTGNCMGPCLLADEANPPGSNTYSTETILLHELMHCAMGLGHHNNADTSFTNTVGESTITFGIDEIRGSFDDVVTPLPGARVIHWFRKSAVSASDNDPVTIDGTVIQDGTFSRRIQDLTGSNRWPASGNRAVTAALGFPNTASPMLSLPSIRTRYAGLTVDDVNTIQFAMTGLGETVGGGDDYTIEVTRVDDCADAAIRVDILPTLPPGSSPETISACVSVADVIPGEATNHYVLSSGIPGVPMDVVLRSTVKWDHIIVFLDEFETSDFRWWSQQSPEP